MMANQEKTLKKEYYNIYNEVINNSPFVEKMFESLDAGIISDK